MRTMEQQQIDHFISFLDAEIKRQTEERSRMRAEGKRDLAYYAKMRASQTEMIKEVFLGLVNKSE